MIDQILSSRSLRAGPLGPPPARRGLVWLLLMLGLGGVYASGVLPEEQVTAVLAGIGLALVASKRPAHALIALIVLLPFSTLVLAKLYSLGVSASTVESLAAWKEALILGVVVAGFRGFQASGRDLDRLDLVALAFVAVVAVYALAPTLFAAGAPTDLNIRSLGLRQTAGFVIVMLAARHAPLPPGFFARAMRVGLAVSVVVAAIAIYEFLFSDQWNDFVVRTLEYARYQVQILEVFPDRPSDYRVYGRVGGEEIIRVGSVFLSALACGVYLLIGFGIGIERVVRRGAQPAIVAALLTIGAAVLLTQTRTAIIGGLFIALLAFGFAPGRRSGRRIQLALLLAVGVLLAIPLASSTGLADRATTTASSDDPAAPDHLTALRRGVRDLVEVPLGHGLGTSAGTGQRFDTGAEVVSENNYLQMGNELGIFGMVVFVVLTVTLLRELRRAAQGSPDLAVAAVWISAVGLAVAAFFLHIWIEFAVAWTLWALAGGVLGHVRERALERARESVDEATDAGAPLARPTGGQVPRRAWTVEPR